jgi:hypothetical protein
MAATKRKHVMLGWRGKRKGKEEQKKEKSKERRVACWRDADGRRWIDSAFL